MWIHDEEREERQASLQEDEGSLHLTTRSLRWTMLIIFLMWEPLDAIQMDLDEEEDSAVYGWLYDHHPLMGTK